MEAIKLDVSFNKTINWQAGTKCDFKISHAADVWRISVQEHLQLLPQLAGVLSSDEIARANRYLRKEDHDRFIVSRAALRYTLSKYTGKPPDAIVFELEHNRKPYLSDSDIHYNLSDSGDQVLIAVARQPVGIDVEYIKPQFYYDTILPLNFTLKEIDYINGADSSSRFFLLWTRKEAIIKATGIGLTDHLKQIHALDGLHSLDGSLIDTRNNWRLSSFLVIENYMATIATDIGLVSYNFYEFNSEAFFS